MAVTSLSSVPSATSLVAQEVLATVERLASVSAEALDALASATASVDRVFVMGAGRSGLALRMTAMRLMHLGLDVHVVGDTTTPAIKSGELLLVASGSGTTESIVRAAQKAAAVGARIAAITVAETSTLASLAEVTVLVPAAQKQDRSESASAQYAGSLFEQLVVMIGDGLFHALWERQGTNADDLWPRHANLE